MENHITITLEEYKALMLALAKTAIIEKMLKINKYVSPAELRTILGLEEEAKDAV